MAYCADEEDREGAVAITELCTGCPSHNVHTLTMIHTIITWLCRPRLLRALRALTGLPHITWLSPDPRERDSKYMCSVAAYRLTMSEVTAIILCRRHTASTACTQMMIMTTTSGPLATLTVPGDMAVLGLAAEHTSLRVIDSLLSKDWSVTALLPASTLLNSTLCDNSRPVWRRGEGSVTGISSNTFR